MAFNYQTKRSEREAVAEVDAYVEPHDCFVTYINNKWGWQSFSTTGDTPCAHYVAHQLGLSSPRGATCKLGFLVRVQDVVGRLRGPLELSEVQPGDVWARLKGHKQTGGGTEPTSHCGMVCDVQRADPQHVSVTIKHCSSGQRMVATNDWTTWFKGSGHFYRLPKREETAGVEANRQRLVQGFAYRTPFAPMGSG